MKLFYDFQSFLSWRWCMQWKTRQILPARWNVITIPIHPFSLVKINLSSPINPTILILSTSTSWRLLAASWWWSTSTQPGADPARWSPHTWRRWTRPWTTWSSSRSMSTSAKTLQRSIRYSMVATAPSTMINHHIPDSIFFISLEIGRLWECLSSFHLS